MITNIVALIQFNTKGAHTRLLEEVPDEPIQVTLSYDSSVGKVLWKLYNPQLKWRHSPNIRLSLDNFTILMEHV